MKKIILYTLLLVFIPASLIAQDRVAEIRSKLFNRSLETVIVVAHRGDWRGFPENSIAAIESSIKMGVDIVEVDVQRTKDGKLILMHDTQLDRTTTGKGKVSEWSLDSMKTLKLKNGCAIRTKHNIPTLEEALIAAKGKVMLNLDKADRYFDEVYTLIQKTGTTGQIIMKGTKSAENVKSIYGKYLESVIYMPIINLDKPDAEEQIEIFIKEINPVAFEFLYVKDSNPLPKRIKENLKGRSLIWYNTLWDTMAGAHDDDMSLDNPDKGYGYLIDTLGARIIQTDRPKYLIDYLKSRNLHNSTDTREDGINK